MKYNIKPMKWHTTLVLVVLVIVYAIIGAVIFSHLEADEEQRVQTEFYSKLNQFFGDNECINATDVAMMASLFQRMFVGGLSFTEDGSVQKGTRWDYLTSLFVSVELIGTVGYPISAPKTTGGRIFTVFFGFIGIPFFILSAIGFGQTLNFAADLVLRLIAWLRYGARRADVVSLSKWMDIVFGSRRRLFYRLAMISIVGSALFVLIPSIIFSDIEGWSYAESLYYSFTTLVTLGFGDLVPGYSKSSRWYANGWYRLGVACWLLIVVGWFAGTVTSFKALIFKMASIAEKKVESTLDNVTQEYTKPKYTIDRVGEISVVMVASKKKKSWFGRKPKMLKTGDVTAIEVGSRATPSNSKHATSPSAVLSNTSVVKIGS